MAGTKPTELTQLRSLNVPAEGLALKVLPGRVGIRALHGATIVTDGKTIVLEPRPAEHVIDTQSGDVLILPAADIAMDVRPVPAHENHG